MGDLKGAKVLVLGLGETGLSMAQWAARCGASLVRVADTRVAPPGQGQLAASVPAAQLRTGAFEHAHFQGIDLVAISPGVPMAEPVLQDAVRRGYPVVGDIELFAQALPALYLERAQPKLIGVTGTNGKSTVTALTGAIVRAGDVDCEVAGNISPAALTALMDRLDRNALPEAWVLELSSYQLETTHTLDLDAAAMLNLSEDHLDRYRGIAEYGEAKARIFNGTGLQVLNRDDAASMAMRRLRRRIVTFGLEAPAAAYEFGLKREQGEFVLAHGEQSILPVREMKLAGLHNAANALAALGLTSELGLPRTGVLEALRTCRGLPHRVEPVAEVAGVRFYDDSKATNVGSTVAALNGFAKQLEGSSARVVLIAGGDGKGQNFAPLKDPIDRAGRAVVLIGRDGARIRAAIAGTPARLVDATSMADAVERARRLARPGDIVLLSPACASFDMFNNYKHRGELFAQTVRGLPHARRL